MTERAHGNSAASSSPVEAADKTGPSDASDAGTSTGIGIVPIKEDAQRQISYPTGGLKGTAAACPDWLPQGFRCRGNGSIEYQDKEEKWQWLCSAIEVAAMTRSQHGEDWGRLLRVRDRDGNWHEWAMPMSELAGNGDGYRARLLALGLELAPGAEARKQLQRLLTIARPQARARCVATLGWHGDAYLLPDQVIGAHDRERLVLQTASSVTHAFGTAGSLQDWRKDIAEPAVGNSRLVFAISMGFAAPLLRRLDIEGGGFHFRGASSIGKTMLGQIAGSVCGGGRDGYIVPWRTTDNALESVASIHNDGLLVLDEINQVGAEALGAVPYMLANGQAKSRMTRELRLRQRAAWRLIFLSTGEVGLADKLRESRRRNEKPMAGQEVRVLDLPGDAEKAHGVFDHLAGFGSGQALADHLKRASSRNYGLALRAFLRKLIADRPFALAEEIIDEFVNEVTPAGADGQVRRAARRFGVVAAGGELATRFGILPWPEGQARSAAKRLFEDWVRERGGVSPAEIEAGITAVRHFLELHGASRFAPFGEGKLEARGDSARSEPYFPVAHQAGYRKEAEGGVEYLVTPEVWRRTILVGHDATLISREMARRGLLKTNADGKPQIKVRIPGAGERKMYGVFSAIFE